MKTKSRHVRVFSAPSETEAWVQIGPKAIDVIVQNPACLTTAPIEQMARHEGTTGILRLTRRQIAGWLKEGTR